jgi:hypothetical protein
MSVEYSNISITSAGSYACPSYNSTILWQLPETILDFAASPYIICLIGAKCLHGDEAYIVVVIPH